MAAGRMRSTRRLRSWIVEQVSSGKYPGVMWDDEAKTMFRIPWKHAGKHDFRQDEDAALFKAWAEFKGKLASGQNNPAAWKTRLRCALNKSPEFTEVMERSQLDISEPYKVYRLVPLSEQGVLIPETKIKEKSCKKLKRRSSDSDSNITRVKRIKTEEVTSQLMKPEDEDLLQDNEPVQSDGPSQCTTVDEIRLDVRIEETVTTNTEDGDSFSVAVHYLGQEVLKRQICGPDVRIMYMPSSSMPPTPAGLNVRFPRILLPEPPPTLPAGGELQALFTLLPFMEKGIVLTSTLQGVYGRRFCQGRIFWTGPHTTTPGLHRMERNMEPVLLFSKDIFKQQLDHFQANGGERPKCSFTLCFGEEFGNTEDPSQKLIIAQISLPWAEQQVENVLSIFNTISVFQTLASQSPLGEITLNLITVPSQSSDLAVCPSP